MSNYLFNTKKKHHHHHHHHRHDGEITLSEKSVGAIATRVLDEFIKQYEQYEKQEAEQEPQQEEPQQKQEPKTK